MAKDDETVRSHLKALQHCFEEFSVEVNGKRFLDAPGSFGMTMVFYHSVSKTITEKSIEEAMSQTNTQEADDIYWNDVVALYTALQKQLRATASTAAVKNTGASDALCERSPENQASASDTFCKRSPENQVADKKKTRKKCARRRRGSSSSSNHRCRRKYPGLWASESWNRKPEAARVRDDRTGELQRLCEGGTHGPRCMAPRRILRRSQRYRRRQTEKERSESTLQIRRSKENRGSST